MKNSLIELKKNEELTYKDYIKMAEYYLDAAAVLGKNKNGKIMLPLYYLLSHSLELYLKAYIFKIDPKRKSITHHNLKELLNKCRGLCLTALEIYHINLFNDFNDEGYVLRYPKIIKTILPNYQISIALLKKISKAIKKED